MDSHITQRVEEQISSPFYIHPNENPASPLIPTVFDGSNFLAWSRSMIQAFEMKIKIQLIEGSILMPDKQDPLYYAWRRCNTLALAWIRNSVSPPIAQSMMYIEKASDAWKDLVSRFSQHDVFRMAEVQEEIAFLKQGNLSVTEFFTQLRTLWNELAMLKPAPVVSADCSCGGVNMMRYYDNVEQVIRFLRGLSDVFAHVRSQILLMNPIPDINQVFALVVQQERQLSAVHNSTAMESTVFST